METNSGKNNDAAVNQANGKTADTLKFMYQLRTFASVANFNQLERNDSATIAGPVAMHTQSIEYIEVARQRLKKIMAQTWMGRYYENVLLFLSVESCLEYIPDIPASISGRR